MRAQRPPKRGDRREHLSRMAPEALLCATALAQHMITAPLAWVMSMQHMKTQRPTVVEEAPFAMEVAPLSDKQAAVMLRGGR